MEIHGYGRLLNTRNLLIFTVFVGVVYIFRGRSSDDQNVLFQTVEYDNILIQQSGSFQEKEDPHTKEELAEGNFTKWARQKFNHNTTYGSRYEGTHTVIIGERLTTRKIPPETHRVYEKIAKADDEDSSWGSLEGEEIVDDNGIRIEDGNGDQVRWGEDGSNSLEVVDGYVTWKDRLHKGQTSRRINLMTGEELNDMFPLSSLLPQGGNTLPNYLLRGINQGLTPSDYRNGVVAFLHHNKAAGSSIKLCLDTMSRRGVLSNHSMLVVSSKIISTKSILKITKHNLFAGGYTFWLCERFRGNNCSYFTIMRNPFDRILSSYYYCKVQYWDQLCGPVRVGNFTIKQWAIYQGNYFFNQLLMNREYCQNNQVIRAIFESGIDDVVPPDTSQYVSYEKTFQCWFKEKVVLSRVLNETTKSYLLQHVLNNLEQWFSVIGLTEDFDTSLRMLSETYGLPFFRRCRGKVVNKSPDKDEHADTLRERFKLELQTDKEVVDALKYDLKIYAAGQEIFKNQKQRLHDLMQSRITIVEKRKIQRKTNNHV